MADRALEIVSLRNPADFGLPADILGVGDKIIEVAGAEAKDQVDFHFHTSQGESVSIKVERRNGDVHDIVLPTTAVDGMEIFFEAMDFRRCRCKCPFCFVDQMPKGMRETLYVKDEDFRLSFLYGNFTTMNDMTDAELDKIIEQRNTPQWVSVHVIEESMRRFIFGRPMKRDIRETLLKLAEGDIKVHAQAVIIPGKNDEDYLRETIETLSGLHPNIVSMAVVPVGLTKYRDKLPGIRAYRDEEMGALLDLVEPYRQKCLKGPRASHFVFPSDEWYVGSGRDVPHYDAYEDFPQLDNGIGSIRSFLDEIDSDLGLHGVPTDVSDVRIVTGSLGARVFERYVFPFFIEKGIEKLPTISNVDNDFFGATVTCSGLLIGADISKSLADENLAAGTNGSSVAFIPPNCLNHEGKTIDGMDLEALSTAAGMRVVSPGESIIEAFHEFSGAAS